MTEMSPLGTLTRFNKGEHELPDAERFAITAKQGRPVFGCEMKIIDDAGNDLPSDGSVSGNLVVRGPWIVKGYMKLLENVRGEATSKDVIATVMSLSKKIGKIPVLVGVCEGFVGNRMLRQRGVQSAYMMEEGALPQQIDKVVFDYGFPMGPFAMSDLAGNDVGWRIRQGKKEKEQRS